MIKAKSSGHDASSERGAEWAWVAALRTRLRGARRIWLRLLDARISFVPILLGTMALLLPQGRDVVRDLANGANVFLREKGGAPFSLAAFLAYGRWAAFLVACLWSGLIAWYWPLLLTRNRWARVEPGWFTIVRRALGLAPMIAAVGAILVTGWSAIRDVWIGLSLFAAATGGLAYFFYERPRRIAAHFRDSWVSRPSRLLQPLLVRFGGRAGSELTEGDDMFVIATFGISFLGLGLFILPVVRTGLAVHVGAAAIAFGAVGAIIAGVSSFVWLFAGSRLPVISVGAVLLALFSFTNDNHDIRAIPSRLVAERPTIAAAYDVWNAGTPDGPLILVASAGGASRAAYWTATVLRALDDRTAGRFSRHVFAISSVSGGSLGALGYSGWVASHPIGTGPCRYDADARRRFDQDFAGADYLSPAVAGLLYPDLIQRFLPVGVLPDRAGSIEEAFTLSWRKAMQADPWPCSRGAASRFAFDQDMLTFWREALTGRAPWVPIALLNGTLVESGKRIITAPVQIEPAVFEDSHDFFNTFGASVDSSTAVMNSARFPIVSPAATVHLSNPVSHNSGTYHIVDGGYFENGGLETAYDLARYLRTELKVARPILIVEINNDDEYAEQIDGEADLFRYPNAATSGQTGDVSLPVALYNPMNEALAPGFRSILSAFYQTRTSRGILAAKRLSAFVAAGLGSNTYRATFRLAPLLHGQRTAMSWSLSLSSRQAMDEALAKPGLLDPATFQDVAKVQTSLGMLIRCERVAADQIALALGSVTNDVEAGCSAKRRYAWTTGVPIDPARLRWPLEVAARANR